MKYAAALNSSVSTIGGAGVMAKSDSSASDNLIQVLREGHHISQFISAVFHNSPGLGRYYHSCSTSDAITAFAVPNPNWSSQSSRIFRVWLPNRLPLPS